MFEEHEREHFYEWLAAMRAAVLSAFLGILSWACSAQEEEAFSAQEEEQTASLGLPQDHDREFYYEWLAAIMRAASFSAALVVLPWACGAVAEEQNAPAAMAKNFAETIVKSMS